MPNKDTATNWWLPSQRQEFLSNLLTPEEPMVSTTSCSIKPQLTKRSVLTITTSAVVPYSTTHITADTTQCTYWDNVSSDFLLAQRRRHQQLLQQHLLPESKEQETLDSAGPHGQLSNAKLDLTGLWDLAKQEDPVLASPSAESGEPDWLVFNQH